MKVIQKDKSELIIITSLGKISIKDDLVNIKKGKATHISIWPKIDVNIQGGPRVIVMTKEILK